MHPVPDWVEELRPHQTDAIAETVDHYRAGAKVVFLDGPTGTGKTLIAQRVAAELGLPATYVCTNKQLQDQFVGDFRYARVLKGRANYPTLDGDETVTADDCTSTGGGPCMWCEQVSACPYQVAKRRAATADLAVLNTSYLLTEANLPREVAMFSRRPFVIADEADELEGALLNYVEYQVPSYVLRDVRMSPPKKGVHKPTMHQWLRDLHVAAHNHLRNVRSVLEPKQLRRWNQFLQANATMIAEFEIDMQRGDVDDETGRWIRDYDTATFKLVPIVVAGYGMRRLWRHGHRWLAMSATLISSEHLASELGLVFPYQTVTVPMTFPVENRPIYLAPVADVTFKADDAEYERLALAVANIAERHPDDRILVHTVSYRLNRDLLARLRPLIYARPLITYDQARDKMSALEQYRRQAAAILLAPSLTRGVDLSDDDCRVVVIAKCPFPSFGDKRVGARVRHDGGQLWYSVQTVREIVQMTGRGVRSADDHAVTYILDRQFTKNVYRKSRFLFPAWWKEAVDTTFSSRVLLQDLSRV